MIATRRRSWIAGALMLALACGASPSPRPAETKTSPPPSSAPSSAPTGLMVTCHCFSWIHLDENGEICFADEATCAREFASFARDTKAGCEAYERASCLSKRCTGGGQSCERRMYP